LPYNNLKNKHFIIRTTKGQFNGSIRTFLYYRVRYLKHNNMGVIALLLFGMVVALTHIVCADQPVPAVPETQGFITGTTVDVDGLAMETDSGAMTLTNDPLVLTAVNNQSVGEPGLPAYPDGLITLWQAQLQAAGGSIAGYSLGNGFFQATQFNIPQSMMNEPVPGSPFQTWGQAVSELTGPTPTTGKGIHDGVLDPGQVQYTTIYDANIVAQAGHTSLIKSMNINTGNKVVGESNINAQTGLTYIATADGGNVVGSENLMLDGAGMSTTASDRILCPFAAVHNGIIPAYCNIVQAGSRYDLTVGSVTTIANDKFVSNNAGDPVIVNYAINVKPYGTTQGQILASGSTMAYIKAHIQEARTQDNINVTAHVPFDDGDIVWVWVPSTPQKAEDLSYSESSSAQGKITAFNKEMSYSSQVNGVAIVTPVPTQIFI
jgi:hypothetical protein